MLRVCNRCGKRLEESQNFCPQCGAPAGVSDEALRTASSLRWLLFLVIGLLVLATTVPLGQFYRGYRAKRETQRGDVNQRLQHLAQPNKQPPSNSVPDASRRTDQEKLFQQLVQQKDQGSSSVRTAPGSKAPDTVDDLPPLFQLLGRTTVPAATSFPSWRPVSSEVLSAPSSRIPLRAGLTVVTSVNQAMVGDYESIKRVTNVTDARIEIKYSANMPYSGDPLDPRPKSPTTVTVSGTRVVQRADLETSHHYEQDFVAGLPEIIPGTTAINVSRAVLQELKSQGESSFTYHTVGFSIGAMLGRLGGPVPSSGPPKPVDPDLLPRAHCRLERVGTADVAIPVLVNSETVQLPALHASCSPDQYTTAQFYFLDDLENPLALAWQLEQNGDQLQVVKIFFPGGAPAAQIAQELSAVGRAEIYGIYFDFASASIRPESEPVLQEIANAMTTNPSWSLNVGGHTDNIGGDSFNQVLSERRAAAVKQALVEQYHVSADRLTTVGYGSTRPKEPNDTLEGRARNRRVELVRL